MKSKVSVTMHCFVFILLISVFTNATCKYTSVVLCLSVLELNVLLFLFHFQISVIRDLLA